MIKDIKGPSTGTVVSPSASIHPASTEAPKVSHAWGSEEQNQRCEYFMCKADASEHLCKKHLDEIISDECKKAFDDGKEQGYREGYDEGKNRAELSN